MELIKARFEYVGTGINNDPIIYPDEEWVAEVLIHRHNTIEKQLFYGRTQIDAESKAMVFINASDYHRVLLRIQEITDGKETANEALIYNMIEELLK